MPSSTGSWKPAARLSRNAIVPSGFVLPPDATGANLPLALPHDPQARLLRGPALFQRTDQDTVLGGTFASVETSPAGPGP